VDLAEKKNSRKAYFTSSSFSLIFFFSSPFTETNGAQFKLKTTKKKNNKEFHHKNKHPPKKRIESCFL